MRDVLTRNTLILLIGGLVGLFLGYVVLMSSERLYSAQALVSVDGTDVEAALRTGVGEQGTSENASHMRERLLSRDIAETAIDRILYTVVVTPHRPPDAGVVTRLLPAWAARSSARLEIRSFHAAPDYLGEKFSIEIVNDGEYVWMAPGNVSGGGMVDEPVQVPGVADFEIGGVRGAPGQRYDLVPEDLSKALMVFRSRLSVSQRGDRTNILAVSASDPDGTRAEEMVSAVIEALNAQELAERRARLESALSRVLQRVEDDRSALVSARDALDAFRRSRATVDISTETDLRLRRVSDLRAEVEELTRQRQTQSARLEPGSRSLERLDAEITELERQIASANAELQNISQRMEEFNDLEQSVETARERYSKIADEQLRLELVIAELRPVLQLIDEASASPVPIAPNSKGTIAVSVGLGLLGGLVFSLLGSGRTLAIQRSGDLVAVDIPILGAVHVGNSPTYTDELAAAIGAEVMAIVNRVRLSALHGKAAVCFLTGNPETGSTSIIAEVMARQANLAGIRTCVVDADVGGKSRHTIFSSELREPGLIDYLSGRLELADIGREIGQGGLTFIPPGSASAGAFQATASDRVAMLISALRETHELVVISAPSVLVTPEVAILAPPATIRLYVVDLRRAGLGEIRSNNAVLGLTGAAIDGLLVNG